MLVTSCVGGFRRIFNLGHDNQSITIVSHNFSARNTSEYQDDPQGPVRDWILRRERLAILDAWLRENRTDILMQQQSAWRSGSKVESDESILAAGALEGFQFKTKVESMASDANHLDDSEDLLVVSVAPPLQFREDIPSQMDSLNIQATVIESQGAPIIILNVDGSEIKSNDTGTFYQSMISKAQEFLNNERLCGNRLIVSGFFPAPDYAANEQFLEMTSTLKLVDACDEDCAESSNSQTTSLTNPIFTSSKDEKMPARNQRILVHKSAKVLGVHRAFDTMVKPSPYVVSHGYTEYAASKYFGVQAEVLWHKCNK